MAIPSGHLPVQSKQVKELKHFRPCQTSIMKRLQK